jgi:hypothetical protein
MTATKQIFLYSYFFEATFASFSKIKSIKKSQNMRKEGFSSYFCLMIEGSGDGSVPRANGFGSGRPNNIRFRIPSTAIKDPEQ